MINFLVYTLIILQIASGVPIIFSAVVGSLVITMMTLLLNVGINLKSFSSFLSVMIVLLVIGTYSGFLVSSARLAGFSKPEYTDIVMLDLNIGLNMADVAVTVVLFKLLGAMIDTSVAISSFLSESLRLNPSQTKGKLFQSGMNVGRDILGTTTNTLYFAFLGSFMMLFVWFSLEGYSFAMVLNSKIFVRELMRIIMSALGCVLIIPITAGISIILSKNKTLRKIKIFDLK